MSLTHLEKFFEDGLRAIRKERYNHACDCFAEAMEIDPQLPQIHYNIGIALGQLYRWEDARASFRMALRLQPHPDSWVHLGLAELRLRCWKEALVAFEEALKLEPASEVAQAHRADVAEFLTHQNRYPDSCPSFCSGWYDTRLKDFVGIDPEIIPKGERHAIREYIRAQLEGDGVLCDHTHNLTEEWALKNGLEPLGVSRFLYDRGLRCDCLVLEEEHGQDEHFLV